MLLKLEPRGERSQAMTYATPFIAIILTLIAGSVLFSFLGHSPQESLYTFFVKPVSDIYGISELLVKATPLVLCATGLAIGFRANVWNIGAEGQLVIGAITGGGMALLFHESDGFWLLPLMLVSGILGGMAWAGIPAFLKTRFNANEILTSLMLTYVAGLLLSYLVHGPYRDPDGFNFPESRIFHDAATLPVLFEGGRVSISALIALLVVAAAWVLISRSLIGFQIRVVGMTPSAGSFAGFNAKAVIWFTLLLSGGLAGLAGVSEVAGPIGQLLPVISPGYGFTAIIVAFLGRLHPVGILFAGLLMALSYLGGEAVQIDLGMPLAVTGVFQGMLLFFLLSCDVLIRYRIRRVLPAGAAGGKSA
jgi:simple sugar transport system permease protein